MDISDHQDIDNSASSCRTVQQKLSDHFSTQEGNTKTNYSDEEIQQISDLLRALGRQSWSTVPRVYIVLRLINQLQLLDMFIDQGITDIWFPFTERSLPDTLSPSMRAHFLECQSIILTKGLDLENWGHRKHTYFSSGEPLPFEVKAHLGSGGYGTVDKVVSLLSYREYARKTFKRGRNFSRAKEDIRSFLTEIQVLKRIQHIHCVELIGSYTDPKYFAFIMLPVADWNMTTYMASAASSANKRSLLRSFFGCLANGLQYLHGSKIRHRDIKPENILIKDDRVLLSDFGIALDWEHLSRSTTTADSAKSPIYCAPEVAQYRKRNASSDIWSLGCVFLEMVTVLKGESISDMRMLFKGRNGHYRFYGNTEATIEWIGKLRHIGSGEDDEPLNWVTKMLEWNPESRPTASALFADINRPPANVLTIFCGPCCGPDEDSSGSVDSDGELWIDDDESLDAEVICDTSGLGHMSTPQSNSTDRSTPSHSPAPCQKEAPDKADLGGSVDDVGKKAEAMYKRALEGREKTLGPDHKSTLDTAYNLGKLYMDQGKPAEAEALYQRALTGYEEVLGPDHCYTLDAIYYLGKVSLDQGKLPEAEALYQRALTGREKALGPEHRSTLDTVYNTGIMYSDLGRLAEAEPLYQRAIAGYEAVLGPEHVCTLNVVGNLGRLYALQRRREEEKKM